MTAEECELRGIFLIRPKVHSDNRGLFFESFNTERFRQSGLDLKFVQDNISVSGKNVLRGLHFQNPPSAQGKLVGVLRGSVLDVAVDIRLGSPTYGQHYSIELSDVNRLMLYIPEGFAHGFLSLEDNTIFSYKCTALYDPSTESTLAWNDADLAIRWPVKEPIVAKKDRDGMAFRSLDSKFRL